LANQRAEPIPVFAEMGSVNPVVISPLSLIRKAEFWAGRYADSMTQSAGQFCTNPGIIFVPESKESDVFSQILTEKLELIENQSMLHPSIFTAYSKKKGEVFTADGVELISEKGSEKENYMGHVLARTSGVQFLKNTNLHKEVFGVFSMMVTYKDEVELTQIIEHMEGQLTGTVIVEPEEISTFNSVIEALKYRVGRIIFNGVPTGVEVCPSMHHGGPYPASTDARFTAVGTDAIYRWVRPISFQNFPEEFDIES
jgi:NADP-dependent aldehyde dehydrogenase